MKQPYTHTYISGVIAVSLFLAFSPAARAQHWSVHGAGAVVTAYSDNANNGDGMLREPEASFYYHLRPSLLFTYETPRTIHVTTLGIDVVDYLNDAPVLQTSVNGSLRHGSLFALGPGQELALGAEAILGQVRTNLGEAGQQPVELAAADASFRRGNVSEAFRWQLSRDWRLNQGLLAELGLVEIDQGTDSSTRTAGLHLGIDRTWARTALGITGGVTFTGITQTSAGDSELTRQVTSTIAATMRRDIGPRWSSNAQVGMAALSTVESSDVMRMPEETQLTPTFALGINYFRPMGTVTLTTGLTARHAYAPNILLGTTTESTSVVLTAGLPLPWLRQGVNPRLRVSATSGWVHSRIPGLGEGVMTPSWSTLTADMAATFAPDESWEISLRYQFLSSMVEEGAAMAGVPVPMDFDRNTVLVQVSGRWPGRPAVTLPDRRALRVDDANQEPRGERERGPMQQ
jgi:hypothetical protein